VAQSFLLNDDIMFERSTLFLFKKYQISYGVI